MHALSGLNAVIGKSCNLPIFIYIKCLPNFLKNIFSMDGFDFKDGQLVCKRCGSRNVSVKAGMMTDRAWCNNCGNEGYV